MANPLGRDFRSLQCRISYLFRWPLFCAPSGMCASSNVYPNTRSFKYTINFRPIHTVYDESAERRTNFYGEWKFAMNNVMINEALCEPKRSGLVFIRQP